MPDKVKKIKLNFYFHTPLWYLKRFYEGRKGLHKTSWGTTKKCENKNLTRDDICLEKMYILKCKSRFLNGEIFLIHFAGHISF